MDTVLIALVCALVGVLLLKYLTKEPQLCSMCGRLSHKTTTLANGRIGCKDCIMSALNTAWDHVDRECQSIEGSSTLPRRVVRHEDPALGHKCPLCGVAFRPLDPICIASDGITHLACWTVAERFAAAVADGSVEQ